MRVTISGLRIEVPDGVELYGAGRPRRIDPRRADRVERNVINGNRGAALQGRADVSLVIEQHDNDLRGNAAGAYAVVRSRRSR